MRNATEREDGFDAAKLAQARNVLQASVDEGVLPGATAIVARHGQTAAAWHLGTADLVGDRPVTAETLFPLASVTKPLTAALALSLVEAGAIALDEPVSVVLPELRRAETERITLRHLLTHTAGFTGYLAENAELRAARQSLERFVALSLRASPRFPPGAQFCYSNIGVCLIGELAARITGQGYAEALAERVLHPWNLGDVYLPLPDEQAPRAALVRDADYGGTAYETFNSPYFRGLGIPWGGAYATADAVRAFAQSFLDAWSNDSGPAPLGRSTRRLMTSPQMAVPPAPAHRLDDMSAQSWPAISWGLGWDVKADRRGHFTGDLASGRAFGHLGASGTCVWADPEAGVLVVLLANQALRTGWAKRPPRHSRFANAVMAAAR